MIGIRLKAIGEPATVEEVPDPVLAAGAAVVRVVAVRIPAYTANVFSGSLGYDIPTPLVPGPTCIGQIEAVAEDVFHLQPGQVVLCNSLLSSGGTTGSPDEILIGWTGTGTERSGRMQQLWRNGSFAEKALYPAPCLTVLPGAESWPDVTRLPFLASLAIADGGFRRGGLRGGQTVIINGATGNLGGAAAMVALARGASRVVVVGRRREALNRLVDLDPRVTAVELSGIRDADTAAMRHASDGGADLVLDVIAHTPTPDPTLACIDALRIRGTAVLVGGVRHDLPIDYQRIQRQQLAIVGSFMFDHATVTELWNLVRSGALDLSPVNVQAFSLDSFPAGVKAATGLSGLDLAVLVPSQMAQ